MHNAAKVLTISASLLMTVLPALAHANNSALPFSGTYVGVDGGPAWASSNYQTSSNCVTSTANGVFCVKSPDPTVANGIVVANSGTGEFNLKRFNYDVHVGHAWNIKNLIIGGEAEVGGLNAAKSAAANGVFPVPFLGTRYSVYDSISTNWLATLRARVGVVFKQQYLVYATGGPAFTDFRMHSSYRDNAAGFSFPGGSGSAAKSIFRTGWTVGAGGELQLNDAYSIKLEYLFVRFNYMNLPVPLRNTPAFTQSMLTKANFKTDILRIGLNYRF